jgi:hypothetical protein
MERSATTNEDISTLPSAVKEAGRISSGYGKDHS